MQNSQKSYYENSDFACLAWLDLIPLFPIQKAPLMRRCISLLITLAALIFSNVTSAVVAVTTDPVGFTTTSLLGSSDTYVSIPFTRMPEFTGAIQSIAANDTINHRQTMTVSGTPGWTNNQFAGTQKYYALIGASVTKEGHTYAIKANGSNTVTVDTTQDNLDGIPVNTQLILIPNWTPATIFPASDAGISFTPTSSPGTYPGTFQTLIRVPADSYAGQPPTQYYQDEYYFYNGAWRRVSNPLDNINDRGNDALLPDSYFVVRNNNGAPTLPMTSLGSVLLKKLSVQLMTVASPGQDNPVSLVRPLDVALNATGLGSVFGSNDQLLLFNNAAIGMNKSPSATYVYNAQHWRLIGDATSADRGSDVIPTGTGFLIRKVGAGASVFWTNSFPLTAISAVSRKSHGGVPGSPFDIPLPLSGTPGIECRSPGQTPAGLGIDYQIIFTFPAAITINTAAGTQGATVTSGMGSVDSTSVNGTLVTVNLKSVSTSPPQRITVTLFGVNDGTNMNDVGVRVGFLPGDTSGNGLVNSTDISQVQAQSGKSVTSSNFRTDVTANGLINSTDISTAQSKSGTGL
jgi:uncharacterized protein (TIGR02597 family)